MQRRVHIWVTGRVQGVFFRLATQDEAIRCKVVGWVGNLSDGRVEAVFEGDAEAVGRLVSFCRQGPRYARVDHIEVREEEYLGEFEGFFVLYH